MDIASLSLAMSAASLQQQASLAIMKKQMDVTKVQGNGLIKMMDELPQAQLVPPSESVGTKVDVSV